MSDLNKGNPEKIRPRGRKRKIVRILILSLILLFVKTRLSSSKSPNLNFDNQIIDERVINDRDVNSFEDNERDVLLFEDNDRQVLLVKGHGSAHGFTPGFTPRTPLPNRGPRNTPPPSGGLPSGPGYPIRTTPGVVNGNGGYRYRYRGGLHPMDSGVRLKFRGESGNPGGDPGNGGGNPGYDGGNPGDSGGNPGDSGGNPGDSGGNPGDSGDSRKLADECFLKENKKNQESKNPDYDSHEKKTKREKRAERKAHLDREVEKNGTTLELERYQIEAKLASHGVDFGLDPAIGVDGKPILSKQFGKHLAKNNNANFELFTDNLEKHIRNSEMFEGIYRKGLDSEQEVLFCYNKETKLVAFFNKATKKFISGWKLDIDKQRDIFLETHNLT